MSYLGELYESFRRISGIVLSLLGISLSVAAFYFVPSAALPLKHVIAVAVVTFIVIAVLIDVSIRLHRSARSQLPKIVRALPARAPHQGCIALLLLEPSELFGQQALVSVFWVSDGFEVLVGLGEAVNIQQDKKIQIAVRNIINSSDQELWKQVLSNDHVVLNKLLIKPSLPANALLTERLPNDRITEQEH